VDEKGDELATALAGALGAEPGDIDGLRRLSGGASRETWSFDCGGRPLILQRARPGRAQAATMAVEARLLQEAGQAGVPVAEVVATGAGDRTKGDRTGPLARPWMVVSRLEGETIPRKLLRDDEWAGARSVLTAQCGRALGAVHAIDPARAPGLEGADQVATFRRVLDDLGEPHPAFELGFRWLERHRPDVRADAVVHGDFRIGNLLVGPDGLRAVLDWELAHLGDPLEDLGWLCVKAWRFGQAPRVGGFGTVDELVAAYEDASGTTVDRDALAWWEVVGTLKWGIMCVLQAATHLTGTIRSVELAALGRRVCEQEHDLLLLLP
jgi:aminoglycoside phosphotransferase (APT) family kinase protein